MDLYIQIQDGKPINHPAYKENLIQAFGTVPNDWEPFLRVVKPIPGIYEVLGDEDPVYEKVDGVWADVWPLRQITAEEKFAKQQAAKAAFANREQSENWAAWVFDEATCKMQPPIPRPPKDEAKETANIFTFWCGAENGWKDTPVRPGAINEFKFDFFGWQWVPLVN